MTAATQISALTEKQGHLNFSSDKSDLFDQDPIFPYADIIFQIFKGLSTLSKVALVSKEWNKIANDKGLHKIIFTMKAFTAENWKHYLGVDAGIATIPPDWLLRHFAFNAENCLLTWIPNCVVKLTDQDAKEALSVDSAAKQIAEAVNGYKTTAFNPTAHFKVENKGKAVEKSHWALISCVKHNKKFSADDNYMQALGNGLKMATMQDMCITLWVNHIKFGLDHPFFKQVMMKDNLMWIRVQNEQHFNLVAQTIKGLYLTEDDLVDHKKTNIATALCFTSENIA